MSSVRYLTSVYLPLCLISFLLWNQLPQSVAELRFCMPPYGPQRMKDTDCPGGFVFTYPVVSPECKYYAKTEQFTTGKVLTAPRDICSEDMSERIIENGGDDLGDIDTLTYFLWEEYENVNETLGEFNPENVCYDDCLSQWEDSNTVVDEDQIEDDFDPLAVPEEEMKELKKMNKAMFLRLLMDEDEEETDDVDSGSSSPDEASFPLEKPVASFLNKGASPTGDPSATLPPRASMKKGPLVQDVGLGFLSLAIHDSSTLNVIKILSKSMKIILGACSPFIHEEFLEQVLRGMIYISRKMEHTFLDVAPDLYKRISKTLDHCGLNRNQEFILNGSRCDDGSVVEGVYFPTPQEYWPYRLTGWSFRWGRWHPLLDAAWSVIDFIHSFCYESFMQDMMTLHVYEMSLEGLFPEKIHTMWRVAPTVNNDKFWNNLLQTNDLNITMRNLGACQEGAMRASPYLKTLPRPFLTLTELSKPSAPSPTPTVTKGWNQTMQMYWEKYERQGGFPKISQEFGKCFESEESDWEEREDMIEQLKQTCS